jgi:hypothetical protein
MSDQRFVLLASIDSGLPPKLIDAMRQLPIAADIRVAFTLRQLGALLECYPPQVIVVDEILVDGSGDVVKKLTAVAPVILLARLDRFGDAARILIHEDVECIAQTGDYVSLLAALVERHVRWARQPAGTGATALGRKCLRNLQKCCATKSTIRSPASSATPRWC